MHHKGLGAEPQALSRIGTGKRTWLTRKQLLAWPIALVLAGFTVGMAVAQTHPDWPDWAGTEPASISEDPLVRAWQPSIAAGSGGRMVVAWSDLESGEA